MAPTSGSPGAGLDEVLRRIRELESRVDSLEMRIDGREVPSEPVAGLTSFETPAGALPSTGQFAPLFGKAFLGLAGAYTLRALTEMGALPVAAGVLLGVVYAAAWLFMASRTSEQERTLTIFRGATASLILIPLVWEAHVRFSALSSGVTASLLLSFTVLGLAVAWRRNLGILAWITSMSSLLATCALLVVTKDLIPFTWALMGIALAVEVSACLNHWLTERWVVAAALNLAALLLVFVAARPSGIPPGYAPFTREAALAILATLLIVYLASALARTLWLNFTMTKFEMAQCVIAFTIASGGAIRVSEGHPGAIATVGLLSFAGALLCYGVSAFFISRHREKDRNFYVYSTFGLLLSLAAGSLLLTAIPLLLAWSLLTIAFTSLGTGAGRLTLKWHGAIYLAAALGASDLAGGGSARFLGNPHTAASLPDAAAWIGMAAAAGAYFILLRAPANPPAPLGSRLLSAAVCLGATWNLSVVLGRLLSPLCRGPNPPLPDYCPTLLTAILVALAFGLAAAAQRSGRTEQVWVAWILLALATYKLLLQDFRQSQNLALVLSLVLYGGTLVLLPRMLQKARRASAVDGGSATASADDCSTAHPG